MRVKPNAIDAITTVPSTDPVASVAHATGAEANAVANAAGNAAADAVADTAGPKTAEQRTSVLEAHFT